MICVSTYRTRVAGSIPFSLAFRSARKCSDAFATVDGTGAQAIASAQRITERAQQRAWGTSPNGQAAALSFARLDNTLAIEWQVIGIFATCTFVDYFREQFQWAVGLAHQYPYMITLIIM